MKYVLPAVLAASLALTACDTTADRRDLFSPAKADGPYTTMLRESTLAGRFDHRYTIQTVAVTTPVAPAETEEPIAPPPPLPPGADETTPEMAPVPPVTTPLPAGTLPMPAATPVPPPAATTPAATPPPPDAGGAPEIPGLSQ